MRKTMALLMALVMIVALCACGAETAEESAVETAVEEGVFADVAGTYDELFTVINDAQYDQLWLDDCAAVVGEEAAAETAEMLKSACAGTLYGQEAVDAYGDGSNGAQFDCFFINGIHQFTFDGNTVSGTDENGNEVFSHEYAYVQDLAIGPMPAGKLYKTEDADAGEFTYFLMLPDTPDSTYHIEFRYGSDIEALGQYAEGPYAYWLAAGIPTTRDQTMIENVINLFCTENLAEEGEEEAA